MNKFLLLAFIFLYAHPAFAAFGFVRSITIQSSQVPSSQVDYPVDVDIAPSSMRTVSNGGNVQNANGYDIYFFSDASCITRIPAEREAYTPTTGHYVGWVRVASLSSAANTVIYVCYGDASISTDPNLNGTYGMTSVWDSHFKGVWHLATATGGAGSVIDSTGNNNGSPVNGPSNNPLVIDGAGSFTISGASYITTGNTVNPTAATYSIWAKNNNFLAASYQAPIFRNNPGSTGFSGMFVRFSGKLSPFFLATGGAVFYDGTGSHTMTSGSTHYLTASYDSSAGLVGYVDAAVDNTVAANGTLMTTAATIDISNDPTTAGRNWEGTLDEARVSDIARSADWTTIDYNNQVSTSTFYTLGDEMNPLLGFFSQFVLWTQMTLFTKLTIN